MSSHDPDAELRRDLEHDVDLLRALGELPMDPPAEEDETPYTDMQFHVFKELYRNARCFEFPEDELARRLGMDQQELHRTLSELVDLGTIEWGPGGEAQ
jgi:hypothetical protein